MKGRVIVLGTHQGHEAAALIVDGQLQDLLIEGDADLFAPGAILRGVLDRQVKGQGGAFVRLPGGVSGFVRETKGLAPGKPVIVQVAGHSEPGKAVPVTTRLLFKSRLSIVTPSSPGLNVSRRIKNAGDRARLESIAAGAMEGSHFGLILRSAAVDADDQSVAGDIAQMRTLAEAICADIDGAPELLLASPGPHEQAARDWSDPAPDEVDTGDGAFARHGIDEWIDALLSPVVRLAGGAHMAIEPTRALIAVDVNTGGDTSPAASLKANIATARDLPRQLRLRGLGGQVAIDFAPMPKRDRAAVEQQLRQAFRGEAAETSLAGWTPLGNFELQRKRDRLPVATILKGSA
ncbi:MAG: ribonuclease E/G [Rhodobacteraceae bacterium]|nr:ribonuclease E/G [Paracoccaceae bacterium]